MIGEGEHCSYHPGLFSLNLAAVERQKYGTRHKRYSLIAIEKSMVLAKSGCLGRGKFKEIRFCAGEKVSRPVGGRFDSAPVADSSDSAELGDCVIVELDYGCKLDPGRFGHRASSRIAGA